jgi:hypothetical protein
VMVICEEYYKRVNVVENNKYDIEKEVEFKEYKVSEKECRVVLCCVVLSVVGCQRMLLLLLLVIND